VPLSASRLTRPRTQTKMKLAATTTVLGAVAAAVSSLALLLPGASASKPLLRRFEKPGRLEEEPAAAQRGQERPAPAVGGAPRVAAKGGEGKNSKKCTCSTSTKKSKKSSEDCCTTTKKSSKSYDTKEMECRIHCENTYCPNDGSCIEKCNQCCTPDFTCDDSDFPISAGEGSKRTLERCTLFGGECSGNEFCRVGDYTCNHEANPSGFCRALDGQVKKACPAIHSPVCGCDGLTYGNGCLAHAAGMNVATNSACEVPGGKGGEECRLVPADTCAPGLYCRVGKYACGEETDPEGLCASMPLACTSDLREVCGCDGRTYPNACAAAAAGVNVMKNEPCRAQSKLGEDCELDDYGYCGSGLFCKVRPYYCKHEVNPQGVCRYEPRAQTCTYENDPVCGCNCKTYGNECQAFAAGVNVYQKGECPKNGCEMPSELPLP